MAEKLILTGLGLAVVGWIYLYVREYLFPLEGQSHTERELFK